MAQHPSANIGVVVPLGVVSLIAACASNGVIGRKNDLVVSDKADMRRFRDLTIGHAVVMGRKTFESIKKPLRERLNVVITSDPSRFLGGNVLARETDDLAYCNSVNTALSFAATYSRRVWVIGGEQIYRQAMDQADEVWLTRYEHEVEGDAIFPDIPTDFVIAFSEPFDHDGLRGKYQLYVRRPIQ